jgi:hypothetical protein
VDERRQIPETKGKEMAELLGCPFYETTSRLTDYKDWSRKSSCSLPPSDIMVQLYKYHERKLKLQQLNTMSLPSRQTETPSKKRKDSIPKKDPFPKKKKEDKKISVSGGPLPSIGGTPTSPAPTATIFEELTEKWGRPVAKLPVYIDFPRLATKIRISDEMIPKIVKALTQIQRGNMTISGPATGLRPSALPNDVNEKVLNRSVFCLQFQIFFHFEFGFLRN